MVFWKGGPSPEGGEAGFLGGHPGSASLLFPKCASLSLAMLTASTVSLMLAIHSTWTSVAGQIRYEPRWRQPSSGQRAQPRSRHRQDPNRQRPPAKGDLARRRLKVATLWTTPAGFRRCGTALSPNRASSYRSSDGISSARRRTNSCRSTLFEEGSGLFEEGWAVEPVSDGDRLLQQDQTPFVRKSADARPVERRCSASCRAATTPR